MADERQGIWAEGEEQLYSALDAEIVSVDRITLALSTFADGDGKIRGTYPVILMRTRKDGDNDPDRVDYQFVLDSQGIMHLMGSIGAAIDDMVEAGILPPAEGHAHGH